MDPSFQNVSWIDYFNYLYKKKVVISITTLAVIVGAAIYSYTIDNQYRSSANILPNDKRNIGLSLIQGQSGGGIGSIASQVLGGGQPQIINRFYILLQSRTTKDSVINKFALIQHYNLEDAKHPLTVARDVLEEKTSFQGKEEGNFIIEVWDKNPRVAKKIAEYYVKRLNRLNNEISTREATEYRRFIEQRYKKSEKQIDSLTTALAKFQEKYGVYELPQQVSGYFSLLASVTQQKIEAEIKLESLKNRVNESSDTYQQAKSQLSVLNKKLKNIYADKNENDIILNFNNLPLIGKKYFNLQKALQIQKQVQKTIVPLYEQAKMEEEKSLPLVTVVDHPIKAERKSWPPRTAIVILSGFSALILCFFFFILKISYIRNRSYFKSIFNN